MALDPRLLALGNVPAEQLHAAEVDRRLRVLESLMMSGGVVGCSLRATDGTNPVAAPYNWTAISLGDERLDSNGTHSAGGSTWTVPVTGWYSLHVMGTWDVNAAGQRGVRIVKVTGTVVLVADETNAVANVFTQHGHSVIRYLASGDVLRFEAYQLNSGAIVGHKQATTTADGSGMDVVLL